MSVSVLLDTSFLITLVNDNRNNHTIAWKYYRLMLDRRLPMYFSSIVAAEFAIKQPISDLPLKNFRELPFNIAHSNRSASVWIALGRHDDSDNRAVVRDDVKLIAQAMHENIRFIMTEDGSTLYKYCERLRSSGISNVKAIKLIDRFDPDALREDGQRGLDLGGNTDSSWGSW